MSGARNDNRLTPPAAPPGSSILDEATANAVAKRQAARPDAAPAPAPPAAEPAAEQPAPVASEPPAQPATVPATRPAARKRAATPAPRRRSSAPAGLEVPMPDRVADGAGTPLQVRIPPGDHWRLKSQTFLRGTNMKRVVSALLTIYLHDPELCEALMEDADRHNITLAELLHDAHVDVAAGLGGGDGAS